MEEEGAEEEGAEEEEERGTWGWRGREASAMAGSSHALLLTPCQIAHTHTHTHAHTRTHTHNTQHTHAHTCTHMHTHAHACTQVLFAPRQIARHETGWQDCVSDPRQHCPARERMFGQCVGSNVSSRTDASLQRAHIS
eukprot:3368558-Rhodomonas_salina.1